VRDGGSALQPCLGNIHCSMIRRIQDTLSKRAIQ